jgi:hypothetical protein
MFVCAVDAVSVGRGRNPDRNGLLDRVLVGLLVLAEL